MSHLNEKLITKQLGGGKTPTSRVSYSLRISLAKNLCCITVKQLGKIVLAFSWIISNIQQGINA